MACGHGPLETKKIFTLNFYSFCMRTWVSKFEITNHLHELQLIIGRDNMRVDPMVRIVCELNLESADNTPTYL